MVTASVVVRVVERVVAVVANCAAVLKQAPFAVVVAAMVSLEHCENRTELDPLIAGESRFALGCSLAVLD